MQRCFATVTLVGAAALLACLAALAASGLPARADAGVQNGRIVFNYIHCYDFCPSGTYSVNPDGTGVVTIARNPGVTPEGTNDFAPAVSPEGDEVAFMRSDYSGNCDIYATDAGGSGELKALADDPSVCESRPTWSPDGTRIAFVAAPIDNPAEGEVYVMDADGTDRRALEDGPVGYLGDLDWSPDGSRIAYSTRGNNAGNVYVMNADGTGSQKLAEGSGPAWSPDGTRMAFACPPYPSGICTANPDGTDRQRIVTDTTPPPDEFDENEFLGDHTPAWSPDGQKIAFSRSLVLGGTSGSEWLYTMNLDGSGLQEVVPSRYNYPSDWLAVPGTQPAPQSPPQTTAIYGPTGPTGPSPAFDFVSSEPGASFECSLDGSDFTACSGPEEYPGLAAGDHRFAVRAVGDAGADPTPAERSFSVDAAAPDGTARVDGGRTTTRDRSVRLALSASDPAPGTGVASVRLRNAGGDWTAWRAYERTVSWRLSAGEGKKTVYAQFRDGAGNPSERAEDAIRYRP